MDNETEKVCYTDKCIWVDTHAYDEKCDDVLLYEYIQGIIDIQAKKKKYFRNQDDYLDFSIYFANKIFMRYKNARQFNVQEDGKPELEKIKSVSNYVQQTIYFNRIMFIKEVKGQKIKASNYDDIATATQFRDSLVETMHELKLSEFVSSMKTCAETAREYLKRIPYKGYMWHRIYMSCMLTLMNRITLSRDRKQKVLDNNKGGTINYRCINGAYQKERGFGVKLYRLSDDYSSYIEVLTNKIMKVVATDLSETLNYYVPTEVMIDDVLYSEMSRDDEDSED